MGLLTAASMLKQHTPAKLDFGQVSGASCWRSSSGKYAAISGDRPLLLLFKCTSGYWASSCAATQ